MNFDRAFEKLLGHEGGFVDHPTFGRGWARRVADNLMGA